MKKIIRHGKIDRYIHTCSKCGCEFSYDKNDLWTMGTLSCPECGKNDLPKNDPLHETIEEQETREHLSNKDVSEIARMQQQIDTFKAALLHASERILHDNKCNMVVIDPLDDCDKHNLKTIFKFIDQHTTENPTEQHPNTHHEPQRQETTVFDIFPQIRQSNAINIVVKTPLDDFTTDPEAELNYDDLNDFAKILKKNRKYGYVTVIPMNANNAFRKTFIEPNLNEKGFLRQDRFATELTTENGVKYMLFFPWSKTNNQNAPYKQ